MSRRVVHFGGRPGFFPTGSNGSSTFHCASVRSARPVSATLATRSPVDLRDVARSALSSVRTELTDSGLTLDQGLARAPVTGEPVLLERLVHNLHRDKRLREGTTERRALMLLLVVGGAAWVMIELRRRLVGGKPAPEPSSQLVTGAKPE